jgi:hypothetical protein
MDIVRTIIHPVVRMCALETLFSVGPTVYLCFALSGSRFAPVQCGTPFRGLSTSGRSPHAYSASEREERLCPVPRD